MEHHSNKLDSLFAAYIKERENEEVLMSAHGFATYKLEPEYVYITDIYVVPEKRQSGLASELANKIANRAKSHSVNMLIGSVDLNANNPDQSIKALHGYGFKFNHQDGSMLYFKKEIS